MRWSRVCHLVRADGGAHLGRRFLTLQPDSLQAIAPWRLIHAEKPLIYVETDRVVEARAMIPDHEHEHADVFLGHVGDLGVKSVDVPAMKGEEMTPIGRGLTGHTIGAIQVF